MMRAGILLWILAIFFGNIVTQDETRKEEILQYLSQGNRNVGEDGNDDLLPTFYKCCHNRWRYEDGKCVKVESKNYVTNYTEIDSLEGDQSEGTKAIVSSATDFQNLTYISGDPVVFRVKVSQPNCTTTKIERVVHTVPTHFADDPDLYVGLSREGYLLWSDDSGYVHQISNQDFCIDHGRDSMYVAVLCTPVCDEKHPCVRKCCNPDQVLHNSTCIQTTKPWQPYLYKKAGEPVDMTSILPHFKIGVPKCNDMYAIGLRDEISDKYYLLLNGTLVAVGSDGKRNSFEPDRFCLDGTASFTVSYGEEGSDYPEYFELGHYSGHEGDQTAILCYIDEAKNEHPEAWRLWLYGCVALISSLFLFLTALVYVILWEYQNIHGWLQFCYVMSLLFAFTFLGIVQLSSSTIQEVSLICCKIIGALIHFLFLSAFFWLTSMNFDLWWTFSGCRPLRTGSNTGEKKRFLCFALFSYGVPSFIAGVGLLLDSFFKNDPYLITPRFGERNCYFYGDKEKLPYFYAPVGFLLTINSIFFISTIYSLHKLQNDTKFATRQSSKQEKKRFLLFMKLFVVMGVLWIFEVVSWATSMLNPQNEHFIRNIFLPTDLLNGAQGVAIFVIFTCKPYTCRQLEAQFKKFSLYLENQKEKRSAVSTSILTCGRFITGLCIVIIPIVNKLRVLLQFCCRVTRSLEGRRHMSHTNTITSTIWDKSRKVSDCSGSTAFSTAEAAGSIELNLTSKSQCLNSRHNLNPK